MKEELFATAYDGGDGLAALLYEEVEFHLPFHRGSSCGITFEFRLGRVSPRQANALERGARSWT
jgi:hypothetical protein